jgi:hypothetical protein
MKKAIIYLETVNKTMMWVLDFNGKEIKDIITSKDGMNEPFETLMCLSDKNIEVISNYSYIVKLAEDAGLKATLDKNQETYSKYDLSESKQIIEFENPIVPDFVNIRLADIKSNIEELNSLTLSFATTWALLKIASYFNSNESTVFEFPLYKDMKTEGLIPNDFEVEDVIISIIESYGV